MNQLAYRVFGLPAILAAALLAGAAAPDAPATASDVVASRVDEAPVKKAAGRLLDVRSRRIGGLTRVDLVADGEIARFELTELKDPPRLALDLDGITRAPRSGKPIAGDHLKGVRFGKHEGGIRVVLDGAGASLMPAYQVSRTATGLRLQVGSADAAPVAVAAAAAAPGVRPERASPSSRVQDVAFHGDGASQQVEVALSRLSGWEVTRPEPGVAVLTLKGAELPSALQRALDTSAFEGPVRSVSTFVDPADHSVRIVASLSEQALDKVVVDGSKLRWSFTAEESSAEIFDESGAAVRTAAFAADAPGYALSTAKSASRYKGRRVSFEFKDIDIHNLLRVIAEVSKRNVVVSDDVKGKITIRLRNVPWDQALDLILKTKGLGKEESGNIIRIAPLKQIEEEAKLRRKALEERELGLPIKVRIIPVNYALAKQIEGKVRDLLTKRGTVAVDDRTNTLVVKDVVEVLAKAEGLVRSLDTQTPQVMIASRIVEASSNFNRAIGVQWGGSLQAAAATANATGLAFPSDVVAQGGMGNLNGGLGVPTTPNWAVSFPAPTVAANEGAGMGFHFGSAGSAAILNLRLTALEKEGTIKTVSAPRVTTIDNREAVISQGVSIPFSQVSAAGVNTVFVEAKLELKVTPHVTADGSVLLKIKATNNQPNPQLTGANNQPSITKREAETEVLVADGDTTVIGGIYTRKTAESVSKVPLFGDIPILGWLFKSESASDDRTELLVFISPTIVNRDASVVAGG